MCFFSLKIYSIVVICTFPVIFYQDSVVYFKLFEQVKFKITKKKSKLYKIKENNEYTNIPGTSVFLLVLIIIIILTILSSF